MKIKEISALEVLDSRGNPTIQVTLTTEEGIKTKAQVPSGASTGEHEALELRDGDEKRYLGKGVLTAIKNIEETISPAVTGMSVLDQKALDEKMLELDGTPNKSKLGANAILGVSLAAARAAALTKKVELYEHIKDLFNENTVEDKADSGADAQGSKKMPIPMCNVINGGAHADSGLDFQEYMLVPSGIDSTEGRVRALSEIYHTLKAKLEKSNQVTAVGDEGGFAPKLSSNEEPLKYLVESIEEAGYKPGDQVSLAMDVAASEFFNKEKNKYVLKLEGKELTAQELVNYYKELSERYPIVLIEDGMAENDWEGWTHCNAILGDKIKIMGDDFTVTNKDRLKQAIEKKALNSILIKLNQIGSITETLDCIRLGYANDVKAAVSHRSGETCDSFISDFAVGVSSEWIKIGAPARSERVAKYNRLLEIA